jgi:hypothetical protein
MSDMAIIIGGNPADIEFDMTTRKWVEGLFSAV